MLAAVSSAVFQIFIFKTIDVITFWSPMKVQYKYTQIFCHYQNGLEGQLYLQTITMNYFGYLDRDFKTITFHVILFGTGGLKTTCIIYKRNN